MSTWRELHDDFLQEVVLYVEDVKITPQQVMRYLTRGQAEFQRLTNIAEANKTVTPSGTPGTDYMETYPAGNDIQEIHEVRDVDGVTLLQTSWQQFHDIIERANSGQYTAFGEVGRNETPANYSNYRRRNASINDQWSFNDDEGFSRIYTIWDNNLYRYPALATDTSFEIWYRLRLEPFSAISPQWAAWFPTANFDAQFTGTGPDAQLDRWESAFVSYAVAQFIRPKNVLSGDQPLWLQFDKEFRDLVQEAIETTPVQTKELVAPYNFSPHSS